MKRISSGPRRNPLGLLRDCDLMHGHLRHLKRFAPMRLLFTFAGVCDELRWPVACMTAFVSLAPLDSVLVTAY